MSKVTKNNTATTSTTVNVIDNEFVSIFDKISMITQNLQSIKKQIKEIQKKNKKIRRTNKKSNKVYAIHKKKKVSSKLLKFMNKYRDEEVEKYKLVSRAEALKGISSYIKNVGKLQIPDNKKFFKPDSVLHKLLGISKSEQYKFLDLNKYLTVHLKVNDSVATATATANV